MIIIITIIYPGFCIQVWHNIWNIYGKYSLVWLHYDVVWEYSYIKYVASFRTHRSMRIANCCISTSKKSRDRRSQNHAETAQGTLWHGLLLTHWDQGGTMTAISQTTFSNANSWMKMYELCVKFHWSLFLRFELDIFQHRFRYWLGAA